MKTGRAGRFIHIGACRRYERSLATGRRNAIDHRPLMAVSRGVHMHEKTAGDNQHHGRRQGRKARPRSRCYGTENHRAMSAAEFVKIKILIPEQGFADAGARASRIFKIPVGAP